MGNLSEERLTRVATYPPTFLNPFTPKSDQFRICPAAPPEILHHTVWRTWLFIAYSDEEWLILPILRHCVTYTFLFGRLGECTFWGWEWKGWSLLRTVSNVATFFLLWGGHQKSWSVWSAMWVSWNNWSTLTMWCSCWWTRVRAGGCPRSWLPQNKRFLTWLPLHVAGVWLLLGR